MRRGRRRPKRWLTTVALLAGGLSPALGGDWPTWRGPLANGVSPETGLISAWSQDGANLIWRQDLTGRSTPVVVDGRVCANGRAGEGITRQEMVTCFDAETGAKIWEHRFNVYLTTVPWTRVGWANPTADPETGYLYLQGVGGLFICLDSRDGRVVWQRKLIEELGFMEGYGGRTQTPTIDEERVIVPFASTSWGELARPLQRLYAFDKRNGDLIWVSTPASSMADKNSQSTPALAVIDGRRLVVQGNGDGTIYALASRTGQKVWEFRLSKRAINTSVVVDGSTVYASHSEENLDEGTMGRVVAIDATGKGDVTATHELWRAPLGAGFSSLVVQGGRAYVVDNAANLHALDAATGQQQWQLSLGTVGKGSPVWADGKLYVTEVNGRFHVIRPGPDRGEILDTERLQVPGGRAAEIYGSPAVAYGRLYFTTEEGIYCLGDPEAPFVASPGPRLSLAEDPAPADEAVASLLVVPGEVHLDRDEKATFRVEAFDERGRALGPRAATWSQEGLQATVSPAGTLTPDPAARSHAGRVVARVGDLTAAARIRILEGIPFREDFESTEAGSRPSYFLGYVGAWKVAELEGAGKVMAKGPSPVKLDRHITFLGDNEDTAYTVEADLMGTREGRRWPDLGLINRGYTLDLMGAHRRLEIRSWDSALRVLERVPFAWEPAVWYHMVLRVEDSGEGAWIRGKVWKKGEPAPERWTLETRDPLPIRAGSPGLYGFSPTFIYFDDVTVTRNDG